MSVWIQCPSSSDLWKLIKFSCTESYSFFKYICNTKQTQSIIWTHTNELFYVLRSVLPTNRTPCFTVSYTQSQQLRKLKTKTKAQIIPKTESQVKREMKWLHRNDTKKMSWWRRELGEAKKLGAHWTTVMLYKRMCLPRRHAFGAPQTIIVCLFSTNVRQFIGKTTFSCFINKTVI